MAVALTFALPSAPAFSVKLTTPSGNPSLFLYTKPRAPVGFQHAFWPHVPPGGMSASSSGCGFPDASYRHTR